MSNNTETYQKNSEIQALSKRVANCCEQAQSPLAARLGWLMQAADDCDKLIVMLNDEIQSEAAPYLSEIAGGDKGRGRGGGG